MFKTKSWMKIIGISLAIVGLILFFNNIARSINYNSDFAVYVIIAKDFLSGNWILHDWTLTRNSFTTTDLPFYIVGVLVRGFSSNLMHNIPAVVYALLVIVSAYVASQGFESRRKWLVRVSVAVGLSLVGSWNISMLLASPDHVATVLLTLIGLFLLRFRNKLAEITAYIVMVLALVGDPLSLLIGPLPILLTIAYNKIRKYKNENDSNYRLVLKVIVAVSSGLIIRYLIPAGGGYDYGDWNIVIPGWSELARNVQLLIQGIPAFYGAYFVDRPIDLSGIGYFTRVILLVCLGYVIWKWLSKRGSFSFLDSVLVFAMPLVIIGFILFPIYHASPHTRYLNVIFIYGIIIIGRYIGKVTWTRRSILAIGTVATLIIITWIPSILLSPTSDNVMIRSAISEVDIVPFPAVADSNYVILGNWLLEHHLYSGYGSYWDSHIVTVYSKGKVSIAPVIARGENGTLSQFRWFSNDQWYTNPQQPPRTFLVYDDTGWGRVNKDTAIKTWGEPSSIEKVSSFTILIWDHPIIPNPILNYTVLYY